MELFDALEAGRVKAVWIIATNPAASLPAAWNAEKALAKAELVVMQDIYQMRRRRLRMCCCRRRAGWRRLAR